jgi:phage terminase Nu1 subunit (DNA packaging protein)
MPTDADDGLPPGVTDTVLNRGQIARALGTTEPTIDRWMADGMPVKEGGTNGKPYQFQLSACWAWKCRRDRDDQAQEEEAEQAVRQMRLALVGGAVGGDSERALSPKERANLYEAEYKYMQAARARGELAPIKQVEELLEEIFTVIRDAVVALPDRLQRECNLQNRQVEKAVIACDDAINEASRKIAEGVERLSAGDTNGHNFELQ